MVNETLSNHPNPHANTIGLLYDAYSAGLSLPQMAPLPGVTIYISERHELYTTTEPQDTGTFGEFHNARRLERVMDTLADRTEERFRDVAAFADSFQDGTFPLALARAFNNIVSIHGENVHLKNARKVGDRNDGDVFIEKTIFTVEPESTELLNTVFNKLLHKNNVQRPGVHQPIVYADPGDKGRLPTITISNVSEHDIRAMGRAVDALVIRYFRNKGVYLPSNKASFGDWQEWGHTFPYPSEVVSFLQGVGIKYFETWPVTATYHEDYAQHDLRPAPQLRGPLGTDASGVFQRWRNIINGLGHHLRGSSAFNLEQNPNRYDRLSIEEGIELRREQITAEQAAEGPGSPRVLSGVEIASEALMRKIEEAKHNKFRILLKAASAIITFGLVDLGLAAAAKLPNWLKFTREFSSDAAAYRAQQREIKEGREILKHVIWYEVMGPRFRELDAARTR